MTNKSYISEDPRITFLVLETLLPNPPFLDTYCAAPYVLCHNRYLPCVKWIHLQIYKNCHIFGNYARSYCQ